MESGNVCSNMVANILLVDPPPTDPRGQKAKGLNSTFAEHSYFDIQIKGNHKCSNIVANILPTHPPYPGDGEKKVKSQLSLWIISGSGGQTKV